MAEERNIAPRRSADYPLDRPRPIERQATPLLGDGPVLSALPNLRVPGPGGWATARITAPTTARRSALPAMADGQPVPDTSMHKLRESQAEPSGWRAVIDRYRLTQPKVVLGAAAALAALALLTHGSAFSALLLAAAVLIGPAVVLVHVLGFGGHASRWVVGLGTGLSTVVIWALSVQLVRVFSDWQLHSILAVALLGGGLAAVWFGAGSAIVAESEFGDRAAAVIDRCAQVLPRRRTGTAAHRHTSRAAWDTGRPPGDNGIEDRRQSAEPTPAWSADRVSLADAIGPYVSQHDGATPAAATPPRPNRATQPSSDGEESGLDWLQEAYGW